MSQDATEKNTLQRLVNLLLFVLLFGYLLYIGQRFLLPVLTAAISVYILVALVDWLGRLPVLCHSPLWLRHSLVLSGFIATIFGLSHIIITTGQKIVSSAAVYQANLEKMLMQNLSQYEWAHGFDLGTLRVMALDKINIQYLLSTVISGLSSMTGIVVLVAIYAAFLLSERSRFGDKLAFAFNQKDAAQGLKILSDINQKIGQYLAVKTLINLILGLISWLILSLFGVEHALFWSLFIAISNYIPYVGSLIGVLFPVVLSLVQFASLQLSLFLTVLLTMAQFFVGNWLEPKMIGRQINLSPFVILVSLSLWSSLWGIAGAILAVPLTSVLVIVLSAFPSTRGWAILFMDDPTLIDEDV
ncbi:AI-2E family transporter [Acinetobacter rudis]|uniref:AI-2E family transporter n=1 Tax=Acinetobacter rudis TaxID=632955 RepID=A0AAW8JBK7_9GAMM|nr:AI-2E family transporter [Acinetobacter rudis]MDQ8937160.1 AI-2E family transporter [Acinetobacter rudis]MDQ8954418.1 AI-2E family transporter [Acinetobacter rudis]MDQ9019366.1 AI-2E family transporter [Acinetobacter rudis]